MESSSPPSSPELAHVLRMVKYLLYVGFVVLFFIVMRRIAPIIMPLVAACGVAYLLDGQVDKLVARGLKRVWAVTLLLVAFLTVTSIVLVIALPMISSELIDFAANLPARLENFSAWLATHTGFAIPDSWSAYLQDAHFEAIMREAAGPASSFTRAALGGFFSVMGVLAELLLIPVFAFYILLDWDHILKSGRGLIPPRHRELVTGIVVEIDAAVSTWIRGQLIVTTLLGIFYAIAFKIIGIKLGITIGAMVGLLTVIPFLGTLVGVALTALIMLSNGTSTSQMIAVGVTFVVLHLVEAAVLTPKLVGKKVGLGEVGALFAVLAGGQLLGLVGVLLAVPIAASLAVVVRRALGYYRSSSFFQEEEGQAS